MSFSCRFEWEFSSLVRVWCARDDRENEIFEEKEYSSVDCSFLFFWTDFNDLSQREEGEPK